MKLSSSFILFVSSLAFFASASQELGSAKGSVVQGVYPLSLKVDKVTDADNVPSKLNQQGSLETDDEKSDHLKSFYMSISMILVSEVGDKTFLIAALMSMKHSKYVVFTAAFSSLAIMTVLSGTLGRALPTLLSDRITKALASVLFLIFGYKLFREALAMPKDAGVDEEMAEVKEELEASNMNLKLTNLEEGATESRPSTKNDYVAQLTNLASLIFSPVWIQVFVMTFLGEWGDRSQIATIAMAAGSDYWFVIFGAVVGHGICTATATIGGQLLATRISMRNVTLGGAVAFIIFAILYFYDFLNTDVLEASS